MTLYTEVEHVDAQITDAQLRDLVANPITLVPAPGPGLFIDVLGLIKVIDTRAGAYAESQINLSVGAQTQNLSGFDDAHLYVKGFGEALPNAFTGDEDAPLQVNQISSDLTGGDPANTLSLRIYYRIEPAVPFGN